MMNRILSRYPVMWQRIRPPLIALLLIACSGAQSALDPHGPAARDILTATWIMLVFFGLVTAAVLLLIARIVFGRRTENIDEAHAIRYVLLGGAVFPAVVVSALFFYSVILLAAHAPERAEARLTVEVTGEQWWWRVRYLGSQPSEHVVSANEIHIPTGQRVRIQLASADVIHSLWIPGLQGKTDLIPGRINVMWLQADERGIYRGQCAEFCGLQHARMSLHVVAHEPAEFQAWLANERRPASVSSDTTAAQGAAVFMSKGCASCHTIRGTGALGVLGPDLTHVAARNWLAAGTLRNTPGELAAWIANPQALKPGNRMPRVALDARELGALTNFLRTLR
jgi:cytochrome c oxidase subunit 2